MIERTWRKVAPVSLTAQGTTLGRISVTSTHHFKVKMRVTLSDPSLPVLILEVKRILSPEEMELGPSGPISARQDLSAYGVTSIVQAPEQVRPNIPLQEIERAVYEEEPTVAKRVVVVDRYGNISGEFTNPFIVDSAALAVIAQLLSIQVLGLPTNIYLATNEGFFITMNDGRFIKAE